MPTSSPQKKHKLCDSMVRNMLSTYQALSQDALPSFNSDYFQMLAAKCVGEPLPVSGTVSISFNNVVNGELSVLPMITMRGIKAFFDCDPNLIIEHSTYLHEGELTLRNGSYLYKKNHNLNKDDYPIAGFFKGKYGGKLIIGYVTRQEVLTLLPVHFHHQEDTILMMMHEMAIYRALYRLDTSLMTPFLRDFIEWHDIRNFFLFNSQGHAPQAFNAALKVIRSRKDILSRVSSLWSISFDRESVYLAHAIGRLAAKHNMSIEKVEEQSYKLSYLCAGMNLSVNPSSGRIYLFDRVGFDSSLNPILDIVVAESVRGKLARAYASAGLKSHFSELVFSGDTFKFNGSRVTKHTREDYATPCGEFIGAYSSIAFIDESSITVFLDASHFKAIASQSDNPAWNNEFFYRMCLKEALKEALLKTDWSAKSYTHKSRFI